MEGRLEYVRNVFAKYLVYLAEKSEREAKTLEKVLFAALQLSPK